MIANGESRLKVFGEGNRENLFEWLATPEPTMSMPANIDHARYEELFQRESRRLAQLLEQPTTATPNHEDRLEPTDLNQLTEVQLQENFEIAAASLRELFVENAEHADSAAVLGEIFEYGLELFDVDEDALQELQAQRRNLLTSRQLLQEQRQQLDREMRNEAMTDAYADGFGQADNASYLMILRSQVAETEDRVEQLERSVRTLEQRWSANLNRLDRAFLTAFLGQEINEENIDDARRALSSEQAAMIADAYRVIRASEQSQQYYEAAIDNAQNIMATAWYRLQSLQIDLDSNNHFQVRRALEEIRALREELGSLNDLQELLSAINDITGEEGVTIDNLEEVLSVLSGFENIDPELRDSGVQELNSYLQEVSFTVGNLELLEQVEALTLSQLYTGHAYLRFANPDLSTEESLLLDERLRGLERQLGALIENSQNASVATKRILGQTLNQVINIHTARGEVDSQGLRMGGGIFSQLAQQHNNSEIELAFNQLANMVQDYEDIIQSEVTLEENDPLYAHYTQAVLSLFINGPRAANRSPEAIENLRFLLTDPFADNDVLLAFNTDSNDRSNFSRTANRNIVSDANSFLIDNPGQDESEPQLPTVPDLFDIRRFDLRLIDGNSGRQGIVSTPLFQHIEHDLRQNQPQLFDQDGNLVDRDFTGTPQGEQAYWYTMSDYLMTGNPWRDFGIPAASGLGCYAVGALVFGWSGIGLGLAAAGCAFLGSAANTGQNIVANLDLIERAQISGSSDITSEQAFRNVVTFGVMTGLNMLNAGLLARPAFLFGRVLVTGLGRGALNSGRWLFAQQGLRGAMQNSGQLSRIFGNNLGEVRAYLSYGEQWRLGAGLSLHLAGYPADYLDEDLGFYMRAAGGMLAVSGGLHTGIRMGLAQRTAQSMYSANLYNLLYQGYAADAFFLGQDMIWANSYLISSGDFLGLGLARRVEYTDRMGEEQVRIINENSWVGDVGLLLTAGLFVRYDWSQMEPAMRRYLLYSGGAMGLDLAGEPLLDGEWPELNNIVGGAGGAAGLAILTGRITGVNALGIIVALPFKIGTEAIMLWQGGQNPFRGFYDDAQYQRRLMSFAAETQGSSVPIMTILRGRAFLMGFPLGRRLIALSQRMPGLRNMQSGVNAGLLTGGPGATYERYGPAEITPISATRRLRTYELIQNSHSADATPVRLEVNNNGFGRGYSFRLNGQEITEAQLNQRLLEIGHVWDPISRHVFNVQSSRVAPTIIDGDRLYNIQAPVAPQYSLQVRFNGRRPIFELNGQQIPASFLRRNGYRWTNNELLDARGNRIAFRDGANNSRNYDLEGFAGEPNMLRVQVGNGQTRFYLNGNQVEAQALEQLGYQWEAGTSRTPPVFLERSDAHRPGRISYTITNSRTNVEQNLEVVLGRLDRPRFILDGQAMSRGALQRRTSYLWDNKTHRLLSPLREEVVPNRVENIASVYSVASREVMRSTQLRVREESGREIFELDGRQITPTALRQMGYRWNRHDGGQLYRTERAFIGDYGEFVPNTVIESPRLFNTSPWGRVPVLRDWFRTYANDIRVQGQGENASFWFNNVQVTQEWLLSRNLRWDATSNRLIHSTNGFRGDIAFGARRLTVNEFQRAYAGSARRHVRNRELLDQHLDDLGYEIQGNRFWHAARQEFADDLVLGGERLNVFRGRTLSTPRYTFGGAAMTAPFLMGAAYGMNYGIFQHTSNGDPEYQRVQRALNYGIAAMIIWPYIQSPLGYDTPIARSVGYVLGFFANGIPAAIFPPYRNGINGFETFISELDGDRVPETDPIARVVNRFSDVVQPGVFFSYSPMRSSWGLGGDVFAISHEIDTSWNILDNVLGPAQNNYFEYEHIANEVFLGAWDCMVDIAENHPNVENDVQFREFVNSSNVCNQEFDLYDPEDEITGGKAIVLGYDLMRDIIAGSQAGINPDIMRDRFEAYAQAFRNLVNEVRASDTVVENERRLIAHQAARLHLFRNRYRDVRASDGNSVVYSLERLEGEYPEIFARMPNLETPEARWRFNITLNGSGAFIDDEAIRADEPIRIRAVDPDDSRLHPIIRDMRQR
ncbi:MAG: hypothetical protein ABH859_01415 [Pseudomonadota bacterium]